jgi:hypothetical protein
MTEEATTRENYLEQKAGILDQSRDSETSIHDNSPNPDIQAIRRPHRDRRVLC